MYTANDETGKRISIDSAVKGNTYTCPACGDQMIIRRGDIVAHHFAHKSRSHCDPWYTGRKSAWHVKMQSIFPVDCQEAVIWDNYHCEYHIADVAFSYKGQRYVFEFQHSSITHKEFFERTAYYMNLGYKLRWIFDFRDKRIYYAEKDTQERRAHFIWGEDRIRILDTVNSDLYKYVDEKNNSPENLSILFQVQTGRGIREEYTDDYGSLRETWRYIDPFHREPLLIEPMIDRNGLERFDAFYYDEEEIYNEVIIYPKGAKPITASI